MTDYKRLITLPGEETEVPLYVYGPGTSSLDAAWELEKQDLLPVWGAVLMESQSAGRGRQGRLWQSPVGHIFGALRLPMVPPFEGPGASLALAVILSEVLSEYGWETEVKWPNDLIYEGGKIGGILIESKKNILIAGVGFNLGTIPPGSWPKEREAGAPPPKALPFTGGSEILWSGLVKKLILLYKEKFRGKPLAELTRDAEKKLLWRSQLIKVENPATEPPLKGNTLTGYLTGLGPEGYLIIVNNEGRYKLWSGAISPANEPHCFSKPAKH